MQPVLVIMRRNQKILFIFILVALAVYYLMIPKKRSTRQRVLEDKKVRHPVSYFMTQAAKNDTFFYSVIHQKFNHPGSGPALQKYLRPQEYSNVLDTVGKNKDLSSSFNVENDVIVYLHIQKVGGTVFNNHLINDLILETPCTCEKGM